MMESVVVVMMESVVVVMMESVVVVVGWSCCRLLWEIVIEISRVVVVVVGMITNETVCVVVVAVDWCYCWCRYALEDEEEEQKATLTVHDDGGLLLLLFCPSVGVVGHEAKTLSVASEGAAHDCGLCPFGGRNAQPPHH